MSIYIGIDWSEDKHDVVFLNEAGAILGQLTMAHTLDGLRNLEKTREYLGVSRAECWVGLETAHNLVIDFLWEQGYEQVYVIAPNVIKSCRGRFGQSGARTDRHDGRLIADVVRTDRARLQPWQPDRGLTRHMRAKVGLLIHLSRNCIRWSNRLRAVLLRYYPAGLVAFGNLTSQISLRFLISYPTPQAVASLSWTEFERFAHQHSYNHTKQLPGYFARLKHPYPEASPDTILAYQDEAILLAQILLQLVQAKNRTLSELQALFAQHPDHDIFSSLPGTGQFLAPALLTKFGDHRPRFPSPAGLQALAGTCPVTDQSGKRRLVKFRFSCDRQFRWIAHEWARSSLSQSVWANAYWQQIRPRCHSDQHAYRCLANRWLAIAWKLWHSGQTYDETYHLQQRMQRSKPRP
jgi:transposase